MGNKSKPENYHISGVIWLIVMMFLFVQNVVPKPSQGRTVIKNNHAIKGRVLLIGINRYKDSRLNIPGCVEDANETANFIKKKYGFKDEEIKILTNQDATSSNIVKSFEDWLIKGTEPGERVFFLYSGHGSQLPDDNGDEADKLDETIIPYDTVPTTGANEIRDDKFEELITQLSGRMAVLLFDSCHSGDISRGTVSGFSEYPNGGGARFLPNPKEFQSLYGSLNGGYSVRGADGSRGDKSEPFVDPDQVGVMSGVVVISAASPRQVAWPIRINGGTRGALSYLFTSQGDENISLQKLREKLTSGMVNLYQQKKIQAPQDPQFEVISSISLDDQPLFLGPENIPEIALANPQSSIKIKLKTIQNKTAYWLGEKISYEIQSNTDGYLYLLVFSSGGIATCLLPNSHDRNNQIQSGKFKFPRKGYEFIAQEPIGRDIVVALVSKTKLNLGEKEDYKWEEVFQSINLNRFSEFIKGHGGKAIRTVVNEAPDRVRAWQSASLIVETQK